MNKSGLIEALAKKENLTEKKAIDIVNLIFKGFTDELKKGGRIEIFSPPKLNSAVTRFRVSTLATETDGIKYEPATRRPNLACSVCSRAELTPS